ncbi:MAG: 1-acyl-sn-glycerol-3-phosphate acyltransferase [Bacilli bacterium]|nr:1-acyl-sn-glycerol-3-phosphate acyltransferase [Bacilli bacterium]
MEQDKERLAVLARIEDFERRGIFDQDVEEDPPGDTILPGTVDYQQRHLITRLKARFAFSSARKFLNKITNDGTLRIKKIEGIENLDNLQTGAVITCNHFNALDSFAMQVAYEASTAHKKRKLFRVIREGNYTSFPGFYGMLMRSCNTLPLSSNMATMKEFLDGVEYHLNKGHLVLVYPEQSMWWNYRKPKPLKRGAFTFAAKAKVPVVPIFICQEDSKDIGPDGFPIQEMTIFVLKPILPNTKKHVILAAQEMADANYAAWKEVYESFYHEKLTYSCGDPFAKHKA